MALTNKLTAIADAIRAKTGGTSPLTLPEMATAISAIPTGADNCKCFTVTVSETKTGEISLNPDGDSDIAAHYTDNTFCAGLMRLGEVDELSILGIVQGNVNLRTGQTAYGGLTRASGSAVSYGVVTKTISASSTHVGGTLTVGSGGVISYYGSGTIPLAAGSYIIVCGW